MPMPQSYQGRVLDTSMPMPQFYHGRNLDTSLPMPQYDYRGDLDTSMAIARGVRANRPWSHRRPPRQGVSQRSTSYASGSHMPRGIQNSLERTNQMASPNRRKDRSKCLWRAVLGTPLSCQHMRPRHVPGEREKVPGPGWSERCRTSPCVTNLHDNHTPGGRENLTPRGSRKAAGACPLVQNALPRLSCLLPRLPPPSEALSNHLGVAPSASSRKPRSSCRPARAAQAPRYPYRPPHERTAGRLSSADSGFETPCLPPTPFERTDRPPAIAAPRRKLASWSLNLWTPKDTPRDGRGTPTLRGGLCQSRISTRTSSPFARMSGTYMAPPRVGNAWNLPGTSARRS